MQCHFGDILPIAKDALKSSAISSDQLSFEMILNPCGEIASRQWYWLEKQYPYAKSHAFVVMPNHVHGVLEINSELLKENEFPPKIKSLSELIGAYKTTTSKQIHLITTPHGSAPYAEFAWHRSFHDHIIRTENSYHRIVRYIQQNPANWARVKQATPPFRGRGVLGGQIEHANE
jgi:REP element-mobilizing transposase RayT